MDNQVLANGIILAIFGTLLLAIAARSIILREKDYRLWFADYSARIETPETDPARLRELWKIARRERDQARREAAYWQRNPEAARAVEGTGQLPAPPPASLRTNILAVLGFVSSLLGGLIGIVLGHIALVQIKRTGDGGRGLAIAALVLGYLWLAGYVAFGIYVAVALAMRG